VQEFFGRVQRIELLETAIRPLYVETLTCDSEVSPSYAEDFALSL
jgi:hypothetical protein